jgi:uncharacterized membrane protein
MAVNAATLQRRYALALLALIVLGGMLLRCESLDTRSLWFDEAFSWRIAQFSLAEGVERIARDNHPPLYFILLKLWTACLGDSAVAMRFLSVVLGGATLCGMYMFMLEAFAGRDRSNAAGPAEVALFVTACVALSVFQIRWAWEVRMYTLATCLAAFSSWALLRALRTPSPQAWIRHGFLCLLFAYAHYYAFFSIAGQFLFLAGYLLVAHRGQIRELVRSQQFWHAIVAVDILLVGFLPWLPAFLRQRTQVQNTFWSRPIEGWDLPNVCFQMLASPEHADFGHIEAIVAISACVLVMIALLWKARSAEWYIFTAVMAPFGLSVLTTMLDTKLFHLRYFLIANLSFWAAFGVVLSRLPFATGRRVLYASCLATLFCVDLDVRGELAIAEKPGMKAAVAWIEEQRQPDEPIVVSSALLFFPAYYHASDREAVALFDRGEKVVHYHGAAALKPEDLMQVDAIREQNATVWTINMGGGHWGHSYVPQQAGWRKVEERRFPEVYRVQGTVIVIKYEVSGKS